MKNQSKKSHNILRITFIQVLGLLLLWGCTSKPSTESEGKSTTLPENPKLGAITYSYRSMPDQSVEAILDYTTQVGITSLELMGGPVEAYAGIPKTKDADTLKQWRTTVSMDKFKEIDAMFKAKGVSVDILKLGSHRWSDEEIDYAFEVCKILGATGITMEISKEAGRRMAPFAEKHDKYVIFHNHGQPADPGFSFDSVLVLGKKLMLNLDIGHYYGYTGRNPAKVIERLHDRIISLHIKDKMGPADSIPNKNMPFGQGGTPIVEVLQLIKANNWPIIADIELEYDVPENSDAVQEVAKCFAYCKEALMD